MCVEGVCDCDVVPAHQQHKPSNFPEMTTFTYPLTYAVFAASCMLMTGSLSIAMAATTQVKPLADFSDAAMADQWRSLNDDVMGGISEGRFRITNDQTLEFSGNLSLENQGGFASIRTISSDLKLGGYDTIAIRLKGDGRTYYLNLMTSSIRGASSYRSPIETTRDIWQEIRIDVKDFVYTSFGRVLFHSAVHSGEPFGSDLGK